jgi:hypothetical protein
MGFLATTDVRKRAAPQRHILSTFQNKSYNDKKELSAEIL